MRFDRFHTGGRRQRLRARLLGLSLALLLLSGLVLFAFLFLFRGYVADTPEGRAFRLPLLAGEASLPVFSPGEAVVEGDAGGPEPLRALLLPLETVEAGRGAAELRAKGANAAILDMKEESGALHYVSSLPDAIDARVSAAEPGRNEQIRDFTRRNAYTIARISAFRDDALAQARPAWSLLRESGSPWRDELQTAWLSPASAEAQDYLLSLCRELHALGFDEVLLRNCAYPTQGRQDLLTGAAGQDAAARRSELAGFYARLQELSAESGLRISVYWTPSEADAAGLCESGQSLGDAARVFARIFLEDTPEAGRNMAEAAGLLVEDIPFVSVVSDKINAKTAWAIF